jgi:UvrD-like helicase C-terminal domain
MKIDNNKNGVTECLWLQFDDANVGKDARAGICRQKDIHVTWTPIFRVMRQLRNGKKSNVQVMRNQFPLVVAEAITIHKAQGSTYKEVVVTLPQRIDRNELYVACSRATNASGLYLIGTFNAPKAPSADNAVVNIIQSMNLNRKISMLIEPLINKSIGKQFVIFYQNIQSLAKHIGYITTDVISKTSDLILCNETWSLSSDVYDINGRLCIHRNDNANARKPLGSIAFGLKNGKYSSKYSNLVFGKNQQSYVDCFTVSDGIYNIVTIYKSPKASIKMLLNTLDGAFSHISNCNKNTLVIGDFNINVNSVIGAKLIDYFNDRGLTFILPLKTPSTNGGTQIDLCFSNITGAKASYYESVSSYHKPIVVQIQYA